MMTFLVGLELGPSHQVGFGSGSEAKSTMDLSSSNPTALHLYPHLEHEPQPEVKQVGSLDLIDPDTISCTQVRLDDYNKFMLFF